MSFTIGKSLFFILRVPYSVIEALHGRRFECSTSRSRRTLVNDPIDTFGFDFMQLPEVEVRYVENGDELRRRHQLVQARRPRP